VVFAPRKSRRLAQDPALLQISSSWTQSGTAALSANEVVVHFGSSTGLGLSMLRRRAPYMRCLRLRRRLLIACYYAHQNTLGAAGCCVTPASYNNMLHEGCCPRPETEGTCAAQAPPSPRSPELLARGTQPCTRSARRVLHAACRACRDGAAHACLASIGTTAQKPTCPPR